MKSILFLAISFSFLLFIQPHESHAQLNSLIKKAKSGKKNKKEEVKEQTSKSVAASKIKITTEDGSKSEQLAKEYSELVEAYEVKGVMIYYLPQMLTESFQKAQKELVEFTSKPVDAFYEKTKRLWTESP